jgi:hypothetical protein
MRLTGAVNTIEQREAPRSPSPQWSLSFKRKCRARNMIGCDGNHVMLQCEKLLGLGLAERREVLEKSGLCTFCLKHSAELECYGRGGLSKPRCTRPGCDGEHTPGAHMLMGKSDAEVNIVAVDEDGEGDEGEAVDKYGYENEYENEDGYGYEYECGGWWVGTLGVMEMPEAMDEPSGTTTDQGPAQGDGRDEMEDEGRAEREHGPQVDECLKGEVAEDEQWNLEPGHPSPREERAGASSHEPPRHLPSGLTRPPRPAGAGRPGVRMGPKAVSDQQWEEARHSAWLRQLLTDSSSDEDEDEERYGRFAESGRWMTELYGFPQHLEPTSGGECSA